MTKITDFSDGFSSSTIPTIEAVTKADVGLGNVDNTSDVNKPVSTAQQTALNLKIDSTLIGANNGVAGLDSGGKVPVTQLPNSVMEYKGVYDATSGLPLLVDGTGNTGDVYRVSVAGLGVNSLGFVLGDYVIYNGATWEKAHSGADAVYSVNAQTGAVVLTKTDVGLGNVANVDQTDPANIVQTSSYRFVTDTEKASWNASSAYKDTYANLVTWASTATDAALAFSTDTKILYYVVTGILQEIDVMRTISGTVTSAQVSVGLTAVRALSVGVAPNANRKRLMITPLTITGSIFIGGSSVSISNGKPIIGPDTIFLDWDASDYFLVSDVVGNVVSIVEVI